jgi:hypothetical protein
LSGCESCAGDNEEVDYDESGFHDVPPAEAASLDGGPLDGILVMTAYHQSYDRLSPKDYAGEHISPKRLWM